VINPFATLKSAAITIALTVLVAVAIIQTLRIEGFLFWDGYAEKLDKATAALAKVKLVSEEAERLALAVKAKIEADNRRIATNADTRFKQASNEAGDAATRYIDRWRVRNVCEGSTSQTGSAANGDNPQVPADMPADSVLVSAINVQACTAATAYAIEAHNHAMDKIASGRAMPAAEAK